MKPYFNAEIQIQVLIQWHPESPCLTGGDGQSLLSINNAKSTLSPPAATNGFFGTAHLCIYEFLIIQFINILGSECQTVDSEHVLAFSTASDLGDMVWPEQWQRREEVIQE